MPSVSDAEFGWGGRIRTSEWRFQRPLTYHLSTPHPEVPVDSRASGDHPRCALARGHRAARERRLRNGLHDRHRRHHFFPKPREPFEGAPGAFRVTEHPEHRRAAPGETRARRAVVRQGQTEPAQLSPERFRRRLQVVPIRPATGIGTAKVSLGGRICQRGCGKRPVNRCRGKGKRRKGEDEPLLGAVRQGLQNLAPAGARERGRRAEKTARRTRVRRREGAGRRRWRVDSTVRRAREGPQPRSSCLRQAHRRWGFSWKGECARRGARRSALAKAVRRPENQIARRPQEDPRPRSSARRPAAICPLHLPRRTIVSVRSTVWKMVSSSW